jgi:hypothetical protein
MLVEENKMESIKNDAYLHMIYRARVEIRLYSAVQFRWWNPFSWNKPAKYLNMINRLSDLFHNLPILLKSDRSQEFDENIFWQQVTKYESKYIGSVKDSYRSIFNKILNGEKRNIV